MTSKTLQVEFKNVYGTWKIYPVNDVAKIIAEIAGTKTLTEDTLKNAERLGFTVEEVTTLKYAA